MDESSHAPARDPFRNSAGLDWRDPRRERPVASRGAPVAEHCRPFAWQQAETLWILDREADAWILAELRFDAAACAYSERRRSRYRWQREAAGAFLGRVIGAGDEEAARAACQLLGWLHPTRPHA